MTFAVFAGLALSVSAVPVIVKIFADLRVLHRDLSQLSLSVAVIDDATVWIGLSIIAALVHLAERRRLEGLVRRSGSHAGRPSVVLICLPSSPDVTAALHGRPVRPARRHGWARHAWWRRPSSPSGAVISDGIGLDSTLGAFVCGVIVASGRIVPVARLRPLRTIVLGVSCSALPRRQRLGRRPDRSPGSRPWRSRPSRPSLLAILSKSLGAYGGGRLAGLGHDRSMAVSSALNARGTVQLVVAAAGLRLGLITTEGFTILVLVALVTSAMAGPLIRRYMRRIPATPEEDQRQKLME